MKLKSCVIVNIGLFEGAVQKYQLSDDVIYHCTVSYNPILKLFF